MLSAESLPKVNNYLTKTYFNIKRIIGRQPYSDFKTKEFTQYLKLFKKLVPFTVVVSNDDNLLKIENHDSTLYVEEITALLLTEIVRRLLKQLNINNKNIKVNAVMSVPYRYTNRQRAATIAAAKIANINVLKLIHEPTAAALTYYNNVLSVSNKNEDKKVHDILVYDFGGGITKTKIVCFMQFIQSDIRTFAIDTVKLCCIILSNYYCVGR